MSNSLRSAPSVQQPNTRKGPSVSPVRSCIPRGPWEEVVIDTLELGPQCRSGCHCVLVCVDTYTKWLEVIPIPRHDAASVAVAFIKICQVWGAPRIMRPDNGSEFCNAIVKSLFNALGVRVRTGAVRHPQSQGSAERANPTVLALIRKTLDATEDWQEAIGMLLFQYRNPPHSATGLTPMQAMVGWQPSHLILQGQDDRKHELSAWVAKLVTQSAKVRDYLDDYYSRNDMPDDDEALCPYAVGDAVLL